MYKSAYIFLGSCPSSAMACGAFWFTQLNRRPLCRQNCTASASRFPDRQVHKITMSPLLCFCFSSPNKILFGEPSRNCSVPSKSTAIIIKTPFQKFHVCKSALTAPGGRPAPGEGGLPPGSPAAVSNKMIFYFSVGRVGSMFIDANKDKKLSVVCPLSALESVRVFAMSRCKSSRAFNSSSMGHGGT